MEDAQDLQSPQSAETTMKVQRNLTQEPWLNDRKIPCSTLPLVLCMCDPDNAEMNSDGHMTLNLKYPMKIIWFYFVSEQTLKLIYISIYKAPDWTAYSSTDPSCSSRSFWSSSNS